MMFYKAIAPTLSGKRILVPESDVISTLADMYHKDPNKDYYVSVFKYEDKHKEMLKNIGSLSGIKDVKTNTLIFDFDSKSDIEKAKQDSLTLIGRLTKEGLDTKDINIYFSSNKGFHVELNTDVMMTREEADAIRTNLTSDLETVDTSVKDEQRVIRAPLSKNPKSNLYKIPLTTNELINLSVDQIREEASDISDFRYELAAQYFSRTINLPEEIKKLSKIEKKEKNEVVTVEDKPDFSKNKTGLTNAKYALSQGYFEEGERHEAVMILASTYMALGWHQEQNYNSLKATLRLRAARLGLPEMSEFDRAELWKEVESVYSPLWKGGIYSEDKNQLLIKTKKRYNIEDRYEKNTLVTLNQVNSIFKDFAENIDKNTLKLGIPSFDAEIRITTSTLVALLAPPSSGKSSVAFGILNSTSRDGIKSMFFSLDMATPQVYQRLAQRHTGYDSDRIFKAYQTGDKAVIEKIENTLEKEYQNVKFCFKGAMNVDVVRETLVKEKELTGEFPKLVILDYLENLTTEFSDPTVSKGYAARALKDMANEFGICIILLVQPRLASGDPSSELKSYTEIKGSSVIGECATIVLGMYRPGFSPKYPEDDNFLTLAVFKNRMGKLGTFDYHWDGVTGMIRELTHEEEQTLKKVREQKLIEKSRMDDL